MRVEATRVVVARLVRRRARRTALGPMRPCPGGRGAACRELEAMLLARDTEGCHRDNRVLCVVLGRCFRNQLSTLVTSVKIYTRYSTRRRMPRKITPCGASYGGLRPSAPVARAGDDRDAAWNTTWTISFGSLQLYAVHRTRLSASGAAGAPTTADAAALDRDTPAAGAIA